MKNVKNIILVLTIIPMLSSCKKEMKEEDFTKTEFLSRQEEVEYIEAYADVVLPKVLKKAYPRVYESILIEANNFFWRSEEGAVRNSMYYKSYYNQELENVRNGDDTMVGWKKWYKETMAKE